jgi:ubiquitin C-terminal hydrolase
MDGLNEKQMKKGSVVKKISFWNLPKILVIDLKRFTFNGKKRQNP